MTEQKKGAVPLDKRVPAEPPEAAAPPPQLPEPPIDLPPPPPPLDQKAALKKNLQDYLVFLMSEVMRDNVKALCAVFVNSDNVPIRGYCLGPFTATNILAGHAIQRGELENAARDMIDDYLRHQQELARQIQERAKNGELSGELPAEVTQPPEKMN